jgi:mRNA-degrading endonuclease RelE of RelBE toxin-antitoxin system
MTWNVEVKPSAAKEIRALPDAAKHDAGELIRALYESPIELADTVLEGQDNLYAARFCRGRYRLVYRVSPKQRRVVVLRARPREAAYEGLEPYWFE